MQIDLHTHSTASDGRLTPAELVALAAQAGVDVLALTDHDGIGGLDEARQCALDAGIQFINGIELSVTWNKRTVHIVGLNFDCDHAPLQAGIQRLQDFREVRAREIASKLDSAGIKGAYDGAKRFSGGKMLGRMHFANFLVDAGYAKNVRSVFKKYLVNNKPGHVTGDWATLEEAVSWITQAGGVAVIAHPARYKLTRTKLRKLIKGFIAAGGQAMEVVSGSHCVNEVKTMACHANDFDLYASSGSDFHDPDFPWIKLGQLPDLPEKCRPVWDLF
ncbi:MAG: PHP domain-containing protein [gamma proteobacterium symbiont of Bathyaustriella thionipta]|nr:PHP domain-containing protein [gamma proteobacterium symbiont of Bathyaustriella thionipta]MCU7950099.1 PHP domain-containing protein [gamma proteobacterium symbiont of Bathyaustriella thionipta]MCU7953152.1 PHP domain-containing protein [gamma proteobacterium symbiont of Bathyaustriella thionipta]MCU7956687.1 PHP domain-containing protein [gamma proteobacterium symbiont of Bathyaustriella thionipta]MCU7966314.1 PHP domain-containing protein [gamma proteobacterium symbiont of Bathyaustriella